MIERFQGEDGRRLRVSVLLAQKMVGGNRALAEELADIVEFVDFAPGKVLITQGDSDNCIYFVIAGSLKVVVNGRVVASRIVNDHVGEIAAIDPGQKRSATVMTEEGCLVAKLDEPRFESVASRYAEMYRSIAMELLKRLVERNNLVKAVHEKIRVFIICSAEALPVARLVQNALEHDPFDVVLWSDGVFKVTNYTLQTLEEEVDQADFAVAIAHGDDVVEFREQEWPAPRDNVIFELGLFMGRLGRQRAILMEPRAERVKLPSDMSGVTTIPYQYEAGKDAQSKIASACNTLREHIARLGPIA
ncbi:DNA-binding transcriptional dual regulator Crp [Pseudomonas ogarae]|uniref:TIR domain-containing protein n=1 Tax=Pseudomonas ogarae (strain DSM 112162 / CECT 30235 / F113) TaxID=1114970 RepID=UPI000BB2D84F|nr:TIR domain-containing protein [Pseudomonas ogarae]PBJ08157.1 DNA-binding transcriptional dual regulator Crp [Pseudomonas ogarae]